jgi:SAM-dependent methyltransferase
VNGVDRRIRDLRIARAIRFIPPGARVLDVGCHDGALFRRLGPALREGIGLDPALAGPLEGDRYRLIPGTFPADAPEGAGSFDAVTMLAVLEHVPPAEQPEVAATAYQLLTPGGRLIITVPSPQVDRLLEWMIKLRILHGMEAEQHYGFEPAAVAPLMEGVGFALVERATFQARLNNLFVFERPSPAP